MILTSNLLSVFCFKFTMDIGLDFVINFNIVLYNVVRIYCKLIDVSMYYYVNLLSLYPVIFCQFCKLLYFEKWNAEINQTETETETETAPWASYTMECAL